MSWAATSRYELGVAPGTLALVQDFVNTIAAGTPRGADLLADLSAAQHWLDGVLADWADASALPVDAIVLSATDLVRLRRLRAELVGLIRAGNALPEAAPGRELAVSASSTLRFEAAGRVRALPAGRGWHYVASLLLIETYDAQARDTWRRLKTCSNIRCSAAFFDRSRNNSRVWHDVAACGNLANLHAHRARRRAGGATGG